MNHLTLHQDPGVAQKFQSYPPAVKAKLNQLRDLILATAREHPDITDLEETLKWGEPSYLVKKGSTIRIDWKAKTPGQYAMYFKCTSQLVPTFKAVFGDLFRYENNRAILFEMNQAVPERALKTCIGMALRYHVLKDKPLLGY
ncbi:MAG: DUF1801 domain-containing protein [Lewinella sp.]|nr:DUF1801 domain-containing protein [Lewinella sp.]